ncbi:DUF1801 domain-containing protein [Pedobacter steynii]|uniref:YdhG-like domain-containing protein n=1 Tax=Pedobacter steynii TaxID=430522 RepID=A0A1D7QBS3_9SPHI|nr:DUF1801 domain-containing protein [Pedobacter steynii]AOM76039.1 hypothetical protein BFS30_01980 [Pedobacter steynii]
MLNPLESFYFGKEEPIRSCLLTLRELILKQNSRMTAEWKYGMPFFYFKGKMYCYLWIHKKHGHPYIGIANGNKLDHPALLAEKRARMKILLIDPNKDLEVEMIENILQQALNL